MGAITADQIEASLLKREARSVGVIERGHAAPFPTLDPAALYGIAGEIIAAIRPHTEASDAALLFQLLTALGILIGPSPHIRTEANRQTPALFMVLVGRSSNARKGSSWGQISRLCQLVFPDFEDRVFSGLSSGEGLIWAVRDPIMKREPVRERGRVVDYQEIEIDPGVEDMRALVIEAEFARVLQSTERETNTLSPIIRDAWDGRTLRILTKQSPTRATNPHIGIIGHITVDEFRRCLTDTAKTNGFLNRFQLVCAARERFLPDGGHLTDAELEPIVVRLRCIVESSRRVGEMRRTEEARRIWHAVYPQLAGERFGTFGDATGRAEAQVTRLSVIYALLDESPVVTGAHLSAALAAWQYCEDSARHIFGDSQGDPTADAILRFLRSKEAVSRTEISEHFARNKPVAEINRALQLLQSRGLAYPAEVRTEGRSAQHWTATKYTKDTKKAGTA